MASHSARSRLDLVAGIIYAVLVPVAVLLLDVDGVVRAALALPFVLFVPGYAFLAAVYPERWGSGETTRDSRHALVADALNAGIAPGERLLLSVISSAALTALVALVVNFTPFSLRPAPLFVAIGAFAAFWFVAALVRRSALPAEQRSGLPIRGALASIHGRFTVHSPALLSTDENRPTSRREVLFNVLVAVAVLAVLASAGFAYAAPTDHQQFTEFYVVGENESGNYTVNAVPSSLDAGEERTLYPTMTNKKGSSTDFSVVVELQRAERTDDGADVQDRETVATLSTRVEAGETARVSHDLGPLEGGSSYRVVYLLYEGEPPEDPSRDNADQSLRIWVDVGGDGGSG